MKKKYRTYQLIMTIKCTHDISCGRSPASCGGIHRVELCYHKGMWLKRIIQSTVFGWSYTGKDVEITEEEAKNLIGLAFFLQSF